jgi:hypothetical protein
MALVRDEKHIRLRYGISQVGGVQGAGVVVFDDPDYAAIPVGATVHAFVDRPTEVTGAVDERGEVSDGGAAAGQVQPYIFEHAPYPPTFTAGFVTHRGLNRLLVASGTGKLTPFQAVPAWAAFAPTATGSLVQKGRKEHSIIMPGAPSSTPNLPQADRHLLRMRWTGTPAVGEVLGVGTGPGSDQTVAGTLANRKVAPGSVVITATYGANTLTIRDNGAGRLVGVIPATPNVNSASGTIDYVEGTFSLKFFPGPDVATNILASYEHTCRYNPLDAVVEWDSLRQ